MVTINWKTGGTRPEANGVDGDDNIDDNDEDEYDDDDDAYQ